MRKQFFAIALVVGVPVVVALTLYAPWGKKAVDRNCDAFGGTAVARSVSVDRYFNTFGGLDCKDCFEELAEGQFSSIDVQVREEQSREIPGSPGYYRFSISARTDPNCEWWLGSRHDAGRSELGIGEGECVSIVSIDESRLANYESAASWARPIRDDSGVRLLVNDHVIVDRSTGEAIASQRNFLFVNLIGRSLGHALPTWQCQTQWVDRFDPIDFRARVLADSDAT